MLWRKLLRDLWSNKAAYFACLVVIVIGLMVYTSVAIVYENIVDAKNRFYFQQNFADGFARVQGMPLSEVDRLERVEGVQLLSARITKDVRVYDPDRQEGIYLRLISVNPEQASTVNHVRVIEGTALKANQDSILVDPAFFQANGLDLGSTITLIVEGKKVELVVAGTGQNPEFVYAMKTSHDLYPAPETFGIAYVPFDTMANMFQSKTLVNDIVFTLRDGYSYLQVEEQLKPLLNKYGLEYIIPREDQLSNVILTQEIASLGATVTTIPIVFLGIAAIVLYIMLRRMVEQQRGQIGTLKAFGYTGTEILFHYLAYGLILGLAGGIIGGLLGIALSYPITVLYQQFFALPDLQGQFSYRYLVFGILLSLAFSIVAAFQGSKGILRLQPAEAMRPAAPPAAKKILLERLPIIWSTLTVQGKMAMRNMFRNKLRSFFILLGIALSFSMMAVSVYFWDVGDLILTEQYTKVQVYDVKVSFATPILQKSAERELWKATGVKQVESMLEVPISLERYWLKKDVVLIGMPADASLYNVIDDNGEKVYLNDNGIYLSNSLADELQINIGSELSFKSPFTKDKTINTYVAGVISQNVGSYAYMKYDYMAELLGQGKIITSALLNINAGDIPLLKEQYLESPIIAGIEDKEQSMRQILELLASFSYTTWILVFFAGACGFAIIYSSSIISLSERQRELASLRVLGMSPKEVFEVLSFEQWVTSFVAMLIGIPLAFAMVAAMAQSIDTDLMSIPVVLAPSTFIYAAIGTIASILVAQYSVYQTINRLSLVDVLKERD
jgi:putative ABC transport system permease protein